MKWILLSIFAATWLGCTEPIRGVSPPKQVHVCVVNDWDSVCGRDPQYTGDGSVRFQGDDGREHKFAGTYHVIENTR